MATNQNNDRPGEQINRPPIVPGTGDNRQSGSGRVDAEPSLGASHSRAGRGNAGAAGALDDIAAASAMVGASANHKNQDQADEEANTTTNNYAASGVEHGTTPSGSDAGSGADLNDADSGTGSASRSRTLNDIDTDLGAAGTASGTMNRAEDDMDAALSDDDDILDTDDDEDFEDDDDDTFLDEDEDEDNYSGR
jgi:hypothetical protein